MKSKIDIRDCIYLSMIAINNNKKERYFWTQKTIHKLATFLESYNNPCLVYCPMLGQELERRNIECTILDEDKRFSSINGYQYFNIQEPKFNEINQPYDIIVVNPPFYSITIQHLNKCISKLSKSKNTDVLITHLVRKKNTIVSTLGLRPIVTTSPEYKITKNSGIQYFTNIRPFLM